MGCGISREQLWSWIDRDAPELDSHLTECEHCRATASDIRRKIDAVAVGTGLHRPVPDSIGPYIVHRFLGEGGQALVYEAEQPSLRRNVALKILKGGRFASEKAVRRFQREARALGHLQHPGIAVVYDAGHTEDGLHYFAMECVHGTPLDAHVARGHLDQDAKLSLFSMLCDAVQFAHEHGVIHRDLKPSNVLVQADGSPKILDFGLAKLLRRELAPTVTGTLVASGEGTPRYMSPEQALGKPEEIDERTDVYSLGVILYEMLTGEAPYAASDADPLAPRGLYDEPPRKPSALVPGLSPELEAIVLEALEYKPSDRYPTVRALAEDVERFRGARPILARRPGPLRQTRRWLARRRTWSAIAMVTILVAGALGWRLTARPTFDVESARFTLLEIRRDLFLRGYDPVVQARALDASQRYSRMPEGNLLRAHGLVAAGEVSVAAVSLRAILENNPSQWAAKAMLTEIEARRAGRDSPEEDVTFPDTAEGWYLRSFASIDAHRALDFAQVALQRDAGDPVSLATMAYLSEALDHHEDALQWVSRLIAVSGQAPRWLVYKSLLLFRLGRYQEALAEADHLVAVQPTDPSTHNLRARVARRLRLYDLAVRDLTQTIELQGLRHPSSAWTYFHRGSAHWLDGQIQAAADDYRTAYELLRYPTFANARLFLVLCDLGRFQEARASLGEARQQIWDDPWLTHILDCLAGAISPQELIDLAQGKKQLCEALYYAAEVYRLQGQFPKAIDTYRACVGLGLESDPEQRADEPTDTMTEHELAVWRLAKLAPGG